MKEIKVKTQNRAEVIPSRPLAPMDLSKEYAEVNILRRAYELILENSDMFFSELEKSFTVEREKRESNPMI